ncbi:MAG: hypothetical protein GKS04_03265 [Candidatus Mycalebacterium zealandia]|nr:MAG: hypothetical protein GKS04_03265 [Candidatus Mycalebacterium zealandia]
MLGLVMDKTTEAKRTTVSLAEDAEDLEGIEEIEKEPDIPFEDVVKDLKKGDTH